jgi:hypothetical protein
VARFPVRPIRVATLSVFGTGVLGLLLYLVGYKLMVAQGKLLAALGILVFIVIAGCGLLSVILFAKANEVQEESDKRRLEQCDEPRGDGYEEPFTTRIAGSSTRLKERTTELLSTQRENGAEKR